jgi:dTDP-4-amino-4,6-dideoxygalactose transaminase
MEGFQGAILRVKLRHLEHWTEGRRNAAACYEKHIADAGIGLPTVRPECRHVHHVYAVRHPERDRLQQELGKRGVQTGIHYPIPVHLQPAYADLGYKEGDFPVSEKAAGEVLSLPMFPELTEAQVLALCSAVREAVHER